MATADIHIPGLRDRAQPAPARTARPDASSPVRHIALVVDPSRLRLVHRVLAQQLVNDAGLAVSVVMAPADQPAPPSLELLLTLERLVHRITGARLADRIERHQLGLPTHSHSPDLTIDLCGADMSAHAGRTVRVLYDGMPGEIFLVGALVAGRMPTIEIEDVASGAVLAGGVPSADNAATLLEAFHCVLARVVTLVMALVDASAPLGPEHRAAPRALRRRDIVAFEARSLAHAIVHRLYAMCFYTPHWRTCWRFLDGPDLWQTQNLADTAWNVLPDPGFRFYADPFPFVHDGKTFLFVEDFDHRSQKGVISVVPFDARGPSGPAEPVLEEPWHLSYPFVFAHAGEVWMIPESSASRTITLYRAETFPYRWRREDILIADLQASDATLVQTDGRFWMFAATRDDAGSWSDTLSIFFASRLNGPWQPHRANPVLVDQAAARPAGAMLFRDGQLWRPVQDCTGGYGTGIGLAEVTRLTPEVFEQRLHTVLHADPRWPGRRLHTLNRAGSLECIDGSAYSPRSRILARRLETWSGRREPG